MTRPSVGIIILNFNRCTDTIECIRSLNAITYTNYKILVIDNCSTDGSFEVLSTTFPDVETIKTTRNLGYTGGINFGLNHFVKSHHEYILILNNDTIVESGFLDTMVDAMIPNETAAASCGTILCEHDRERIWYASGKMIRWRGLAVHCNKNKKFVSRKSIEKVSFITGCMLLLRVSMVGKIGVLDERYFMYLDDIEYSHRIITKGFFLLYVPDAVIYHKVLGEKDSAFKVYYSVRNRLLLINTSFRGFSRFIARGYFIVVLALKLVTWRLTNKRFYDAAKTGFIDYYNKVFFIGNGTRFYSPQ